MVLSVHCMFGGSGNIPSFVPNAFAEHRVYTHPTHHLNICRMFGGSGNIPSFVPNAFAEHRADVFLYQKAKQIHNQYPST